MGLLISATATFLAATSLQQATMPSTEVVPAAAPGPVQEVPVQEAPPGAAPVAEIPAPLPIPPQQDSLAAHEDVVVTAHDRGYAPDPARALNAQSFAVTQAIDSNFVGPIAMTYKKVVPSPFRDGVHNFLYNLREPVVFVNFVLQHKIGKAAETVGRFAINSVIGVVGVFDIAKRRPFKLPRRGNGFADTLGFYGVPPGPFMFLPIVGPTTVRDLFGGTIDRLVMPVAFGTSIKDPKFAIPAGVLGALDHRAEFDETLHALHDGAADPYANSRDFYLQRRQAEIDHLRGLAPSISPMSERPTQAIRLRGRRLSPAPTPPPVAPEVTEPPVSLTEGK